MRELLLAFVIALIIGSIINSMQQKPVTSGAGSQIASSLPSVTDNSFEQEVLKAETLVLVDFWAPWCGPCRAEAPIVEELSKDYANRLKVVKLNVDENRKIAQAYSINSIPRLYLFKDGQLVEQIVGAAPKSDLVLAINKHIKLRGEF